MSKTCRPPILLVLFGLVVLAGTLAGADDRIGGHILGVVSDPDGAALLGTTATQLGVATTAEAVLVTSEAPRNQALKNKESSRNLNLNHNFGKIPLYFIPNQGQVHERALFYAKTPRYTLWLTEEGLVFDSTRRTKRESAEAKRLSADEMNDPEHLAYERDVSRLVFLNANRAPEVIQVDETEHKVNYFIGNDESKWKSNIRTSGAVLYKGLYPNIDLKVYGIEKQIEYDFVVRPGGQVSDIGFDFKDVEKTRIDKEGNLVVETEFGELEHAKPACYQVIGGERVEIEAEFKRKDENTYGFQVKEYNENYELIIDPLVLVYSTYLGGFGWEWGKDIAVDSEGAAYVTGNTEVSTNFPTENPIQGTFAGVIDIFIAKVNPSGTALIYSTYLGGSGWEWSNGIAVDSEGAAYVTGGTESVDFPTQNAIQGSYGGDGDAFIAKVDSSGTSLTYSSYLGGSRWDRGRGIAVDSDGAAYVAGFSESVDFRTQNPIQGSLGGGLDGFIAKINSSGSALIYATYLGGSEEDVCNEIALNSEGAVYVTGGTQSTDFPTQNPIQGTLAGEDDLFIAKVNSPGSALIYSTYFGGSRRDVPWGIAVDLEGAAYVTGYTESVDFPTLNPIQSTYGHAWDVFITKVNSSGSGLIYSTYLGGYDWDLGWGMAVDLQGNAYVTGLTLSPDFPTQNPIQGTVAGEDDLFIAKLNSSGSAFVYSTYLGGSDSDRGDGIAVDSEGAVYVTGQTWSIDFPSQNPIQGTNAGLTEALIVKIAGGLSCSGKERLQTRCNARGSLLAKLKNGVGGDSYRCELSDGTVKEGWLNRKGKAKVKIPNMPTGRGAATVFWGCGATAQRAYRCP